MAGDHVAPIIIKRKKVSGGDGHHGGAWKVAYADFVTAMMAFFLLMWLLNATTEKQRKGIADHFSPTIPLSRVSGGGNGSFGGDSMFSEETLSQSGTGASQKAPAQELKASGMQDGEMNGILPQKDETQELKRAEDLLQGLGAESLIMKNALRHVVTRLTDRGLVIELFDLEDEPLFEGETNTPTDSMRALAGMLVRVFALVENDISIDGHTASYPLVVAENPVWDLSTTRADMVRRMLEARGFDRRRTDRVTGHADREPRADNPMAPRNNRIELVLLRSDV